MFEVKEAGSSEEIQDIIKLRYQVLRKPWNQPADTATDELEESCINAYIQDNDGRVIACGRLQQYNEAMGQIRFMAVSDSFQGKGLGKIILRHLERRAADLNLDTIQLQARENALMFYKNCGYEVKEKSFLLWGQIQHFLMEKKIMP